MPEASPLALPSTQAAVSDGKAAATALSNAALTQLHLPALPLGLLADVPGLRPAAEAKLRQQLSTAVAALSACLERLGEAVAGLAAAADSLQQLVQRDAAAPVLAEAPVFASLPLRLVGDMAAEVHAMHQAELGVKAAVLRGCEQVVGECRSAVLLGGSSLLLLDWCCCWCVLLGCMALTRLSFLPPAATAGDLRAADRPDGEPGGGATGSSTGGRGSGSLPGGAATGRAAAQKEEALRRTMQVYLTAWMLSPEVDERRVEAHLAALEADMRGF